MFAVNRKGSVLIIPVIFTAVVSILFAAVFTAIASGNRNGEESQKVVQATNYAASGIEFAKGYMITQTNKDHQNGWKNKIAPLVGKYSISYDNDVGYVLKSIESSGPEIIEELEPNYRKYERTIDIQN